MPVSSSCTRHRGNPQEGWLARFLDVLRFAGVLLLVLTSLHCAGGRTPLRVDSGSDPKVQFDLSKLDADGLVGTVDGKRALSYEFCIPATPGCEREVRKLDRTVEFHRGARGRIGCGADQILCIGNTHQKDFRRVLRSLARLRYVDRIEECRFE